MSESAGVLLVGELMEGALHGPIRHFVGRQGKRIRAGLTELSFALCGGVGILPSEITQSIEWLHAGSLIIDDIQDDSDLRRGHATMHREIGTPLALNAGNFLYFRALEQISSATLPAGTRARLTAEMIRVGRVCHEGQAIDIAAKLNEHDPGQWREIATAITDQKTGSLVSLAMTMGAIAAGAGERLTNELSKFGAKIGFALQMRNDLEELSRFSNHATDRFDDLRNYRVTWPWVWFAERSGEARSLELMLRFESLSRRRDVDGLRRLSAELVSVVEPFGGSEIRKSVDEPLRLLGEYVLDAEMLDALKQCLSPIHASTQETKSPAFSPTELMT
ncbi:MAG: polyprenyl synthetase family protein [Planctomycetota bacterium]